MGRAGRGVHRRAPAADDDDPLRIAPVLLDRVTDAGRGVGDVDHDASLLPAAILLRNWFDEITAPE